MKIRNLLLLALGFAAMPRVAAAAPTVTYNLVKDDNGNGAYTPGSYAVYATDSTGDNSGLALYNLVFTTAGDTATNYSPTTTFFASGGTPTSPAGFSLLRTGPNVTPIVGSEDTIDSGVTIIYGFGQTGGSFVNPFPGGGMIGTVQPTWNAQLLLATGTYSTTTPVLSPASTANVFTSDTGVLTTTPTVVIGPASSLTPEPSTFGILGCMAGGLLYRRPRRRAVAKA